jgi:hypothetical protein
MTLIKSLLLGSAAGIVAVASAQAADLPTKKGAPAAQYVKICTITAGGTPITGFVIPGSDTCLKITGYITGQVEGGNLKTAYSYGYGITAASTTTPAGGGAPVAVPATITRAAAAAGNVGTATGTFNRDGFGYTTRGNVELDTVSNTAYGPLLGHVELQFNHGEGFDNTGQGGSDGGLNRAYVTWAGITAGKANSFYSFTGGGPGWANFLSPDRWGFNQPDLLAYTASFGGGFSATISLESAWANPTSGGGSGSNQFASGFAGDYTNGGARSPDIVGNLKVVQSWGTAGISGVAHEVRAISGIGGPNLDKWGWGVDGGVSFNLPTFGPGDDVNASVAYGRNATGYAGMAPGEMMWGEGGNVNGNGQQLPLGDTFSEGGGIWATPSAWAFTGFLDHHFSPQFSISPEGSYGEIRWTGDPLGVLPRLATTYIVGAVAHYDPVVNLDFELELLYQDSHSDKPIAVAPGTWHAEADGFAARFEVTRSW